MFAVVTVVVPLIQALMLPATLHVKAGPDGIRNGDCPFAHALRIALDHKDVEYRLEPHGNPNLTLTLTMWRRIARASKGQP